ncbi:MAG: glycoside hydrolase family 3 protein [Clostridia bacterium]|nr:glycoside hydrolase family 3 protein [Clostridia bacterium]
MRRIFLLIMGMLFVTSFYACHTEPSPSLSPSPTILPTHTATQVPTQMPNRTPTPTPTLLPSPTPAQMTLEEKVAQLFVIFPEALIRETRVVTSVNQEMKDFLKKYPVGGIILFQANVETPAQLTALIQDLQNASKYPLLMAMDEEGGRVAKIANNPNFNVPKYTSILEVGKTENPALAKELGQNIGKYLKTYGINYNLAPVADVLTNPENTVVGNRSFGSDPQIVAQMVTNVIAGLQEEGVGTCAKHFPGHGDTVADTHKEGVIAPKTWAEMQACELIPFKAAMEQGVHSIMVGHTTTPNVTADGLPNSLSYEMVTKRLRSELGYTGVVITDALNMGAITNDYRSDEAAVLAFLAGCDILLMPKDFEVAYEGVLRAVRDGRISETRLNESVSRILALKQAVMA